MLYHRFYEEDLGWIGASVRDGVALFEMGGLTDAHLLRLREALAGG